jgi:hypothetical protein
LQLTVNLAYRSDEFVELFREILAVNLTCRIVALGRSLAADKLTTDPVFETEYRRSLLEVIGIPRVVLAEIFRNGVAAVNAAEHDFTPKERGQFRKKSMSRDEKCYMCNGRIDYTDTGRDRDKYTLEHIWPRTAGGDSIEENALPACASCNGVKTNYATWGMVAVQSLLLGLKPKPQRLEEIDKTYKFALHYRAARKFARSEGCSMKDAFLRLGPWQSPEILDTDDVAHFFNIRNWRPDARLA